MAITFEQVFPYRYVNTPYGRKAVDGDGNIIPDSEVERMRADFEARQQRSADITAGRMDIEAGERARAQAEFEAGAGGVPWTASEMASGLSGAPRSNIPLDEELPVRSLRPEPVNLGENAADYGWTQVDSGEMERDPATGSARRAGAWSVAAPNPDLYSNDPSKDPVPVDEAGMDAALSPAQAPNARRRLDLEAAGYRPELVESPDGTPVYRYSTLDKEGHTSEARKEALRGRQLSKGMSGGTEYQREQRIARMADELGVDERAVRAMLKQGGEAAPGKLPADMDGPGYNSMAAFAPVREAIRDKRRAESAAERAARAEAFRNQMMLAGSNPRKNLANALTLMDDPSMTEQQRNALRYMLPGGQLAATVDANNAAVAGKMAQQAMTAFLTSNPAASPEQREALRQRVRQQDPAAAGASDIRTGDWRTPEGEAELLRLARQFDNTTGGFSYQDEQRLADHLHKNVGMSKPEAEAAANYAANKNRRLWMQDGTPAAQRGSQPPVRADAMF